MYIHTHKHSCTHKDVLYFLRGEENDFKIFVVSSHYLLNIYLKYVENNMNTQLCKAIIINNNCEQYFMLCCHCIFFLTWWFYPVYTLLFCLYSQSSTFLFSWSVGIQILVQLISSLQSDFLYSHYFLHHLMNHTTFSYIPIKLFDDAFYFVV